MTRKLLMRILAFLVPALASTGVQAQTCTFTTNNVKVCLGGTIQFTSNVTPPAGATISGYQWYFGDGNIDPKPSTANPTYVYTATGNFTPKMTVYFSNGDSCVATPGIIQTVFPLPKAEYLLAPNYEDTQCWETNKFCLIDTSKMSSVFAKLIRRVIQWDDGSIDSTGDKWPGGTICHTYADPRAITYSPTLEVTDTNGCISKLIIKDYLRVHERIDPIFTTTFIRQCDSTPVSYSNGSRINISDVEYFEWDFGDGTSYKSTSKPLNSTDKKMWDNFIHTYYKQGPFSAKLTVKSRFGCEDTYVNGYAGDNVNLPLDPIVVDDTMCWDGNIVEFKQQPLFIPIPGKQQVYWIYNHPPPQHVDSGTWNPKHSFPSCGPKVVNILVWQPPCTKLDTVDSIQLYGPMAKIENPPNPMIHDTERHQCDVRNIVHFPNVSQECDIEGLQYYWDFDDNSNPNSINDTAWSDGLKVKDTIRVRWNNYLGRYDSTTVSKKFIFRGGRLWMNRAKVDTFTNPVNGLTDTTITYVCVYGGASPTYRWHCDTIINGTDTTFVPRNAHYSKDWQPQHSYDSAEDRERCHTPKFIMAGYYLDSYQNPVWCNSMSQVPLALMNPRATGLEVSGQQCLGPMPPYGITFKWSKSKPGCTQQFVSICFDSACCRWPADTLCWTPQTGFSIPPWSPLPVWPTQYKRPYFNICDPTNEGWVTVGLVIHNRRGEKDSNVSIGKYKRCSDTVWYHRILRFVDLFPNFAATSMATPTYVCPRSTVWFTMADSTQDSVKSIGWIWGDGAYHTDTVRRIYSTPKEYQTHRYEYRWAEDGSFIDSIPVDTSIWHDSILYTVSHHYVKRNKYKSSLTLSNTDNCYNTKRYTVIVGNWADVYLDDTIVCVGTNELEFKADIHYWHPVGPPLFPDIDTTQFWMDPKQGGTRTVNAPYKYEKFLWFFDDTINPVSTAYWPKHRFSHTGIFHTKLAWEDSTGCKDTIFRDIYVEGTQAAFTYDAATAQCEKLTKFFDSSYTFGPCPDQGLCTDTIVAWLWDFGDKRNGSILKNPTHQYTYPGKYKVTLIVWSTFGCPDTTFRYITIIGPRPKAKVLTDTIGCVPLTVTFSNESDTANKVFKWDFGDGNTRNMATPDTVTHTYTKPGTYYVFLTGTGPVFDSTLGAYRNCTFTYPDTPQHLPIVVRVLGRPPVSFVPPQPCANTDGKFVNLSDSLYTDIIWDFGDGDTGVYYRLAKDTAGTKRDSLGSITHKYKKADTFMVTLRPIYRDTINTLTCPSDTTIPVIVDDVTADFTIDSNNIPEFKFTNTSSANAIAFSWNFGHPQSPDNTSSQKDTKHNYGNDESPSGGFPVCLVATNGRCYDTVCKPVFNNFEVDIVIPNTFTPDDDTINSQYHIFTKGLIKNEDNYHLVILNRWGQKVFETHDPLEGWNGKNMADGQECPTGSYFFTVWWKWRVWPARDPALTKDKNYAEQTVWDRVPKDGSSGKATGTITLLRKQ